MSRTEKHAGRIKIISKTTDGTRLYLRDNPVDGLTLEVEDGKIVDWDNENDNYLIIKNGNGELCLIQFVEHKEFGEYEDINYKKVNGDGTITFITEYYNGGCWLGEAIEDLIEEELNSE
jgi:hypothetical protein